jgi:hypothetical protein
VDSRPVVGADNRPAVEVDNHPFAEVAADTRREAGNCREAAVAVDRS